MVYDLNALGFPLPEDIEKLKWYGDFDECLSLIHRRLEENIPETLKRKLRLEEMQIRRMRRNYTVSEEEALEILTERIRDFSPEELTELRRQNVMDWIYVKGQIRYISSFYSNLIKIRPDLRARQIAPEPLQEGKKPIWEIRGQIMELLKNHDTVTCRMTVGARMKLSEGLRKREGILHVYLPLALEKLQSKKVELISASPEIFLASGPQHPQRTVMFRGTPSELADCELVYRVENQVRYVDPDPEMVEAQQPDFFLQEQLPHISFTPYLRALTQEVVGQEKNPLRKARRIYDFITTKVTYSFMRSYAALPLIPEYCASRLRGDCGVQALTFVTMCRIAGIPARWQSGLHADMQESGSHDWAMFYVAPYGWMWTDCSYGGAAYREGEKELWDFYFCNVDPYRVVLTSEFQHDYDPPMRFSRADPYDNQTGEVEFEDGPVDPGDFDGMVEVLEFSLSAE